MMKLRLFVGNIALFAVLVAPPAVSSPIIIVGAPVRPSSAQIHATAGLFVSYGILADPVTNVIAERLTIWDAVKRKDVVYTVGPHATIDGVPISCDVVDRGDYSTALVFIGMQRMCTQLPVRLQPGKTWLTLVYWDAPIPKNDLQVRDTYPGTDEIHTLLAMPPPPQQP